jgi:hypothetical protein
MPEFPSVEWFDSVRQAANTDPDFRALGTCDAAVGVKVGRRVFQLNFKAFQCTGVSETDEDSLRDVDFYLEMLPPRWKAFIENISAHSRADPDHTLNTLDLNETEGILRSRDAYGLNSFLRYHLTIQKFFDSAANVETTY